MDTEGSDPAQAVVDWRAAAQLGTLLAAPGPTAERADLEELVAGLRAAAHLAVPEVLRVTRMRPADGRDATEGLSRVLVVDRATWIGANTRIMQRMLTDAGSAERAAGRPPGDLAQLVGAAEVGAALAMVSAKVLGQFDPYTADPGFGSLLLVAPNVLAVQRALRLDADDFRLWVALHEQTHALQFAAAPWLAEHLLTTSRALVDDLQAQGRDLTHGPVADRARALATGARRFVAQPRGTGFLDRVMTPGQARRMADVGAVMALLEGHADVVMDAVGPRVVPSVRAIRKAFDARRQTVRARDLVLRKLLGMEAKMVQYRDGAAFVRAVRRSVGFAGLNAVWTGPETLPTAAEIAAPATWVRRVHG